MLARTLCALVLAALVSSPAAAQTVISVNPLSGAGPNPDNASPLPTTSVAGVVPVSNWNNMQGNGTFANLVNSAGVTTSASLTVSGSTNNWSVPAVPTTGDGSMMQGYLDNSPGNSISMAFSGLTAAGFARYDIYVYFDGDTTAADRVGQYTIGATSVFGRDAANFSGTYTQVPLSSTTDQGASTPSGNYIVFPGLTGDAITLVATVGTAGDGTARAPINGVQIVLVPEPAHVLLAIALTCGGLRASGRRNRPA